MYLLISFWLPQCNWWIYLKHGTYQYVLPHTDIYWNIPSGTAMYCHVLLSTGLYSSQYQIPYFSHFSVQDGFWRNLDSISILYTWIDRYKAEQRLYSALYLSIQVYRIQGKCPVPPCTEKSTKSCILVHTNTKRYILKQTSTYQHILVHTKISIYILEYTAKKDVLLRKIWYVTECIGTCKYRQAQIELI